MKKIKIVASYTQSRLELVPEKLVSKHLCEDIGKELNKVQRVFPEARDFIGDYKSYGLHHFVHKKSIVIVNPYELKKLEEEHKSLKEENETLKKRIEVFESMGLTDIVKTIREVENVKEFAGNLESLLNDFTKKLGEK